MPAIRPSPRDTSFEQPALAPTTFGDFASTLVYDALYHSPVGTYWAGGNIKGGITRMTENIMEKNWGSGRKMEPDQANQEYGVEGELKFDEPVFESYASLLHDRKIAELRREYELQSGVQNHWGRKISGFGVSMASQALDPVNLAAMFLPVVGQSRYFRGTQEGVGLFGRGLISPKTVASLAGTSPAGYRLAKGAIEGLVGAGIIEPFNIIPALQEQSHYNWKDSLMNLVFSSGMAGVLHVAGGYIGDKFTALKESMRSSLDPQTHEAATIAAVNDLVQDSPVKSPTDIVSVDHNVITHDLQEVNLDNLVAIAKEHLNRLNILAEQGVITPEQSVRRGIISAMLENPTSATPENLARMFNLSLNESQGKMPGIYSFVGIKEPQESLKVGQRIELSHGFSAVVKELTNKSLFIQFAGPNRLELEEGSGLQMYKVDGKWHISEIFIQEPFARGKGLGRQLMTKLADILGEVKSSDSMSRSEEANKMWEAIGATTDEDNYMYSLKAKKVQDATTERIREIYQRNKVPPIESKSEAPSDKTLGIEPLKKAPEEEVKPKEEQQAEDIKKIEEDNARIEKDLEDLADEEINESEFADVNKANEDIKKLKSLKGKLSKWAEGVIKESSTKLFVGIDPELVAAWAVRGAIHFVDGVTDFAVWSKKMVEEFGDRIKPHLQDLFSQFGKLEPKQGQPLGDVSRRTFINLISRLVGGTAVTPSNVIAQVAKNITKTDIAKTVKKLMLPSLTIKDLKKIAEVQYKKLTTKPIQEIPFEMHQEYIKLEEKLYAAEGKDYTDIYDRYNKLKTEIYSMDTGHDQSAEVALYGSPLAELSDAEPDIFEFLGSYGHWPGSFEENPFAQIILSSDKLKDIYEKLGVTDEKAKSLVNEGELYSGAKIITKGEKFIGGETVTLDELKFQYALDYLPRDTFEDAVNPIIRQIENTPLSKLEESGLIGKELSSKIFSMIDSVKKTYTDFNQAFGEISGEKINLSEPISKESVTPQMQASIQAEITKAGYDAQIKQVKGLKSAIEAGANCIINKAI